MNAYSMSKLVIQAGPDLGQEFILDQPELFIGRDENADFVIPSPLVSRRHCSLTLRAEGYFLKDLGSSNGTFLNGQRLFDDQLLHNGDQIEFGRTIRLVYIVESPNPVTALEPISATMLQAPVGSHLETQAGGIPLSAELYQPPQFIVDIVGTPSQIHPLTRDHYNLGRSVDNDIVINSPIVSAHHAELVKLSGSSGSNSYSLSVRSEAANPVFFRGEPLSEPFSLHHGDLLRIGSLEPGGIVNLTFQNPSEAAASQLVRQVRFGEKDQLQIGRDPGNDIILNNPSISRYHAILERLGQRYRVRDLASTNGTFVNHQRIAGDVWLTNGDQVRIGPFRFVLNQDALAEIDESTGMRVEMIHLNKWVTKELNLLKDISLIFNPREFVVVVGQSGGGKSTLVDAIAGYRPATDGKVLVNKIDIYQHFDAIRNEIGFVPQKDIIHMELTVFQALDYAAQLRMPGDTTPEERRQRIIEVLQDLDLLHRKDTQISGLSGGQQKRVSIGVELITKPGLFFLDEPSSGLDPGTETALMHLMRRLADQGRNIILITHATKNVMLADKVVFLARGGYLAWFGPPDEALQYFDQFRSEKARRIKPMEFDDIYAILDDPSQGSAEDWAERYARHPAHQQYIVDPLKLEEPVPPTPPPLKEKRNARVTGISSWRQFSILSSRNLRILTRDKTSLVLMLVAPIAIASLDIVMALVLGRNVFDYQEGSMFNAITSFFMTLMYAFLVGAYSQMREFVKEQDIFKRERLVNLKVFPYVSSKVWLAILLAIYQAFIFTAIHHLAYKMPGGVLEIGLYYLTMFLAILAGMMMGLFASALAPNANAAPLLVLLLIVPTLVLAGAMIPLPNSITSVSATRWAYESLIAISGAASDVAADECWALPKQQRERLSLEEKQARGCTCMGLAIFNRAVCNYPGLGAYYDPVINEAAPLEPKPIGSPPAKPILPAAPQPPVDPANTEATAKFLQDLQKHQQETERISLAFQDQLDQFQKKSEQFKTDMEAFQKAKAQWEIDRNAAVAKAEGLIGALYDDYYWAYVDKDDAQAFWSKLLIAWSILFLCSGLLFVGTLYFIKRKR